MDKPQMPKLNEVFVKEFFIVGVVPEAMPKGFFVCGDGGMETASSHVDHLLPTLGTNGEKAQEWFERACEQYAKQAGMGAVVLIKFTGGVIEKIHTVKAGEGN